MSANRFPRIAALVVAGLLSTYGMAHAQSPDDTGVVRITSGPKVTAQSSIQTASCDVTCDADPCCPTIGGANCSPGSGACGNGACGNGSGACNCNNGRGGCNNGECNGKNGRGACNCGRCGNGSGANGCPCGNNCGCRPFSANCGCRMGGGCFLSGCFNNGCGPCGGRWSQSLCHFVSWLNPCSTTCCPSAGSGFVPPTKQPYSAIPVVYQHNYPAAWMGGQPTGAAIHRPAVYMPTDTTQLGYYYQHVPQWQPRPGMIPPAMQPAQWHIPMSPRQHGLHGYQVSATCPPQTMPTESHSEPEVQPETAPIPPQPNDVESGELERSVLDPELQPVIR